MASPQCVCCMLKATTVFSAHVIPSTQCSGHVHRVASKWSFWRELCLSEPKLSFQKLEFDFQHLKQ